jgi:uncharacterized protein (TIGR00299 family) protein
MGAAGDMLAAALLELVDDAPGFLAQMNALGLPGVRFAARAAAQCGIVGTQVIVTVDGQAEGEHHHHGDHGDAEPHSHTLSAETLSQECGHAHEHGHAALGDIYARLDALPISPHARQNAKAVYALLAQAEARVHGQPVDLVHFHEVGALDAVADIVAVCLLMERLAPDEVTASPVHVGSGFVRCAHGLLPVPAPATALLLQGVPSYGGEIRGELCTPTGAALLRHFAARFGPMPLMQAQKIGYGMGAKQFAAANCVRAFWGACAADAAGGPNGCVAQLCCNLDDMTGEAIAFAAEELLAQGALDVFTAPIYMKKGRPAALLTCLCAPEAADRFAALMLRHTTTFGVRRALLDRYTLARQAAQAQTPYGSLTIKTGEGYGVRKAKPEYEDAARAARRHSVPFTAVHPGHSGGESNTTRENKGEPT